VKLAISLNFYHLANTCGYFLAYLLDYNINRAMKYEGGRSLAYGREEDTQDRLR